MPETGIYSNEHLSPTVYTMSNVKEKSILQHGCLSSGVVRHAGNMVKYIKQCNKRSFFHLKVANAHFFPFKITKNMHTQQVKSARHLKTETATWRKNHRKLKREKLNIPYFYMLQWLLQVLQRVKFVKRHCFFLFNKNHGYKNLESVKGQ